MKLSTIANRINKPFALAWMFICIGRTYGILEDRLIWAHSPTPVWKLLTGSVLAILISAAAVAVYKFRSASARS